MGCDKTEEKELNDKKIFAVLGGLVAILFLVAIFRAGSGPSEAERKAADRLAASEDSVAALTAQVEELEAKLAEAASAADVETLSSQVSDTGATLAAARRDLDTVADEIGGIDARLADLQTAQAALDDTMAALQGAPQSQNAAAGDAPASPVAPAADADAGSSEDVGGQSTGQTAVFAEGALRVFVSRVDREGARLGINGDMQRVAVGDGPIVPVGDDFCQVVLDGVAAGRAQLSAICGDGLGAPEGLRPGEALALEEGALRVFASRVTQDGARLSVNGATQTLAVGAFMRTDLENARCRVTLDRVDRGHAKVSHSCGAPVVASDPVGTGQTAVLGDGAARVFVSSVLDRDSAVRMAINGFEMVTAAKGAFVPLDGTCGVSVESIDAGQASFGYECAE